MRLPKRVILSLLLLAFGAGCFEATPPDSGVDVRLPDVLPERVLVRNTSVLDVESGVVIRSQDVLLHDGVIAAIEPHGALSGDLVIEGAGATLVPGLIDMHGHIYASSLASWNRGFPDPEANLRAYAYAGVTSVFDPADGSSDAFVRRDRVARGELVGPRIFTTGPLLTCADGHPIALVNELAPWWIAWYIARQAATPLPDVPTVNQVVDEIAAQDADAVKIVVDSIPLQAPRMTREIASAVVTRARSHGLRVVAHIGTTQDAIDAADAGVALWVHGVYKERIPDDQIAKLAGYGIPVVATIEVFDRYARGQHGPIVPTRLERETVHASVLDAFWPVPEDFEVGGLRSWLDLANATMDARIDNVRRLHRAGVTILAGSDTQSGVFPGAGLHRELAHLVRAGMTPTEAIRAATLDSARWLANGAEPDSGTIAVGKRADLMLVEGDPSADIAALENIRQVFLAGVPVVRTPVATP
jgi:imidazolonepropionase-like amidohydrolase